MKLLVTGGRFWFNRIETDLFLEFIHEHEGITTLIHGDAAGADTLCGEWAIRNNIAVEVYPITKEDWRRLGNKAGPIRNQQMIDDGKPDMLVAFPGANGTADMKRRAKRHKLEIMEWKP